MSADLLLHRLGEDIQKEVEEYAGALIEGRELTTDQLRWHQGYISGLKRAADMAEYRAKNLHVIG